MSEKLVMLLRNAQDVNRKSKNRKHIWVNENKQK